MVFFFPSILKSVVLATYVGIGNSIDISTTFTVGIFIGMLYTPLANIPQFFTSAIEFMVSMRRIQKFLDLPEVERDCLVYQTNDLDQENTVKINGASFSYGVKHDEEADNAKKEDKKDKQKSKEAKKREKQVDNFESLLSSE